MDLSFNLAPSNRDLKDPTTRQNFDDTVEQKRVIDLRACHIIEPHAFIKYSTCWVLEKCEEPCRISKKKFNVMQSAKVVPGSVVYIEH